jgi:hypothetical protein
MLRDKWETPHVRGVCCPDATDQVARENEEESCYKERPPFTVLRTHGRKQHLLQR